MNNTAIYARYSSAMQNDASIEQQVKECRAYAVANGLTVVSVYEDRAISGRKDKRPGLQKMLRAAERGEFTVLLAYKSNRIARDLSNALHYEDRLHKAGVRIVYCKENFGDNAAGRLALRMMMSLNEFYSENMSEDIRRGLYDSARKRLVVGPVPFGYRRGDDGRHAVEPAEAEIVREIFKRYIAGEAIAHIAAALNARGITTKRGTPWRRTSFDTLLHNERYTGVYIYKDIRIEGGMPAIIERSTFVMAQQISKSLTASRRHQNRAGDYMLTGKLICGACGLPLVGVSANGNGGKYYYYSCHNPACGREWHHLAKNMVEAEVTRAVLQTIMDDDMIAWIADCMVEMSKRRRAETRIGEYERALKMVNSQLTNILRAVEKGVQSETFAARVADLERQKREYTDKIAFERATTVDIDRAACIAYLETVRAGDYTDKATQRKIIHTFIRDIRVYDTHFTISVDYTGQKTTYDCLFRTAASGSDNKVVVGDNVHYTNRALTFTDTGFSLVWPYSVG